MPFLQYVVCNWETEGVSHEGKVEGSIFLIEGENQQKGEAQNFGYEWEDPPLIAPLVGNLYPTHKDYIEECAWTVVILKKVRESIFLKQHIYGL